jgi:ribosomal protein L40E
MIWRVIATGGALSFLGAGFTVLSDPNCISADIGGGRIVGVNCRLDSYGAWSGSAAGTIMCLLGIGLLVLIYWKYIFVAFRSQNPQSNSVPNTRLSDDIRVSFSQSKTSNNNQLARNSAIKICQKCGAKVPRNWDHCDRCLNKAFRDAKEEEIILSADTTQIKICDNCKSEVHVFYPKCFTCNGTTFTFKQVKKPVAEVIPEFKACPMCAEDIKFAAKKCRFCQHMMDA